MSTTIEPAPVPTVEPEPSSRLFGAIAIFETAENLLLAALALKQSGLTKLEAHMPYPVHGIDDALRLRPTRLPWVVLAGALVGAGGAFAMQHWMNGIDYPFLISGKPLISIPSSIPVTFEVAILLAAFAAFFGVLLFNGLPRLANPLLRTQAFRRVTSDQFALVAECDDPRFDELRFCAIANEHGATSVEPVEQDASPATIPPFLKAAGVSLAVLALIPPVLIAQARATTSEKPRIHPIQDMDFQPKFKAQTTSPFFDDGRAMRPQVTGTVARGDLPDDPVISSGYTSDTPPEPDSPEWLDSIPLPPTSELMARGRERFNIFCAACHGRGGDGDGIVTVRALELQQGTWVKPISLHDKSVRGQPDGRLFNTITNGVRKMPGYASQIKPADRWAIVLYLRALQRSRTAQPNDVPADVLETLRETN
ncbi:MAG: quinol:electron acceptor oxidoreductase subunit ActD [Planctomycetota bacterium]|jgi:mono/diheme cytochrome c family protein